MLITVVIAIAVIATIAATGGFEPGATPTPSPTPMETFTPTSTPTAEEVFSNSFWAAVTIGEHVHRLGFELFNGSTEAITIREIEFCNPEGDPEYRIFEEDIAEIWGSGEVAPSDYFNGSYDFTIQPLLSEVEEWEAKWYCIRADGQDFVVVGAFEEGF